MCSITAESGSHIILEFVGNYLTTLRQELTHIYHFFQKAQPLNLPLPIFGRLSHLPLTLLLSRGQNK